jgi:very-short-patch-repair endonuclease
MSTSMHYGATMEIFQIAERLRRDMTVTEKMIWDRVSNKQLGVRIRRQHPIWKFIADFYCHEVKLVIEIDGGIHLPPDNKEYDISRDIILKEFQIEILRFTSDEVIKETSLVIETIKSTIEKLKQQGIHKVNQGTNAG